MNFNEDDGFSGFGETDYSNINDLLEQSYAGVEDSGEGDTAAFFQEEEAAPDLRSTQDDPITPTSTKVEDKSFEESVAKLEEESLADLDELKDVPILEDELDLFVSDIEVKEEKPEPVPPPEPTIEADIESLDVDELISLMEETIDDSELEDSISTLNEGMDEVEIETVEPIEVEEEELTPLYDLVDETPVQKDEPETTSSPAVDHPTPTPVEEVKEELTPLYDTVEDTVEETPQKPAEEQVKPEVLRPTPPPESPVDEYSLDHINRVIEILDLYEAFAEEEKYSVLLLLYSGSIDITDRGKVVKKILSVSDEEKETIKTLKELKKIDSVERAFRLMELNETLLRNLSELVFYISDRTPVKTENTFDLARELVKYIEMLKPDLVDYINSTEKIISI